MTAAEVPNHNAVWLLEYLTSCDEVDSYLCLNSERIPPLRVSVNRVT